MVVSQTAEVRHSWEFDRPTVEALRDKVLEHSPGLEGQVWIDPLPGPVRFASIFFTADYGPFLPDWRRHQQVVRIALEVAGVTDRFKPLE